MSNCDLDTSVPDWVVEHPETLNLFRELGVDYCCGGKSLRYACLQQGLEAERVLTLLLRQIERGENTFLACSKPLLASIQVGLPRELGEPGAADPLDRPWTTGFYKRQIPGPVRLGLTQLEGDGQADLAHHGGPEKAVLAYSAEHYPLWSTVLNNSELPPGAFGENFTIAGQTEADVCIGDVWQIGDRVVVQISQPRQPCWKLARRWRIQLLALQVQQTGRTGWYFRVLNAGLVAPGMPLALVERPHPTWSVARANRTMHEEKHDLPAAAELAAIELLSSSWRTTLARRVEQHINPDDNRRLIGENAT
jgi:MOSC domain-containing protein YiiM